MIDRPPASTIPDSPGSYQFKDAHGVIIYVGKARSLRSRLNSYFADPQTLHPRTAQMIETAQSVEWIQVRNEAEALLLEYNLIKEHHPRFNVRLKDDKSYPFLAITTDEEWPRAMVMRGQKRKGVKYFGPYTNAYAIRETLDQLIRVFPVRTCSNGKFQYHERIGRPCLLFHIERCAGPCIEAVEPEKYQEVLGDLSNFLSGNTKAIIEHFEYEMREAAEQLDFEKAARMRDRLTSIERVSEKQQIVGDESSHWDVFGIAEDELTASIQVFYVRRGRVVGRKGYLVDKIEPLDPDEFMARLLQEHYENSPLDIPRNILVPTEPSEVNALQEELKTRRGAAVSIDVPQRGDRKALVDTVIQNSQHALEQHRLKRASDHNARARAIQELQDALGLPEAPLRIECYDMSHLQGTNYVGSMVVFEDGVAKKQDYRRFKVRDVPGNDDYAAMREVLTRRLTNLLEERHAPSESSKKFAYPPQLLLVDGGKGQLGVAVEVLTELGLDEEIPVASLAKQFEEVYLPNESEPLRLPRGTEALYLLQRIRDEAHRFAVTYHRQLRAKSMTGSVLDEVPGLGPVRRTRLLREAGSLKKLREMTREQLDEFSWLPQPVRISVFEVLHGATPSDS